MDNLNSGTLFVTIELQDNIFAIPANCTRWIVKSNQSTPYAILPKGSEHIKCIIELDGLLVTIVSIPGTDENVSITDSSIVVLEYAGQNIGILTNETRLITVSENEISEDKLTGTNFIMHDGKTYIILELYKLYNDLGI